MQISISNTIRGFQYGGGGPPPTVFLLDSYPGATAAYSLRKLRNAYSGSVIRVRRSSDNTETDIGFVSNQLDTATLLTFCGAGNGFLSTWYDQSGNGNNATQTTAVSQAQIVSGGSLITDGGKVAIIGNQFLTLNSEIVPTSSYAGFSVMSRSVTNAIMCSFSGAGIPIISLVTNATTVNTNLYNYNKVVENRIGFIDLGRFLFSTINTVNVQSTYLNNIIQPDVVTSEVGGGNFNRVMGRNAIELFNGKAQEFILYNSNQAVNNAAINTNINSYYNIY
jgi:hypothetical protein